MQVTVKSSGAVLFSPTEALGQQDPYLEALFKAPNAAGNGKTVQRFMVPVGKLFDVSPSFNNQTWYLTLANMNVQPLQGPLGFSIRATCMPAAQVGVRRLPRGTRGPCTHHAAQQGAATYLPLTHL